MKKVSGTLKLDQAQFRELEAFAKFGSDLDAATLNVIEKGRRNVEILKQAQNDPFTVEDQTAIIYAGSKNLLREVPVNQVKAFEKAYLGNLKQNTEHYLDRSKAGKLTDEVIRYLKRSAKELQLNSNKLWQILKEIRNRIASVSSTMQITSAMKMVSAAKLKKAQDAITAMRPYSDNLTELDSKLKWIY